MNSLGDELIKEANKTIVENGGQPIKSKKKDLKTISNEVVEMIGSLKLKKLNTFLITRQ